MRIQGVPFRNLPTADIDRPIFIVGTGRSGTTIFYNLICGHGDVGWFYENWLTYHTTNASLISLFAPLIILFKYSPLLSRYRYRKPKQGWFPIPSEAYPFWNVFHAEENWAGAPPLTEQDVASASVGLMRSVIRKHLHYSGTSRFVSKNTRNSRRMRYLHEIFPDALFIHVMRDGRAVVNSLLHVEFWPSLRLWWCGGETPAELEQQGENPVLIAAKHWKAGIQRIFEDKDSLPKTQYMDIRYETLMMHPKESMQEMLYFCDLPWTADFENHINSFVLENKNYKWLTKFTSDQIRIIEDEIGPTLEKSGY